jgi:hypothetical protein
VSVLCPGLVRTDILNAERHRPASLKNEPDELSPEMRAGLDFFKAAMDASMPPLEVADKVFEAIRDEQFYILTHPDWMEVVRMRVDSLVRLENPRDPSATLVKLIKPNK